MRAESTPTALYQSAASCFERAGYPARAAACLEAGGLSATAAPLYEQAGDLPGAARCYKRARQTREAVRCYLSLNQPEEAAACWEEAGELLRAGFMLAVQSRHVSHARWLATEARPPTGGRDAAGWAMRRRLALALCDTRTAGDLAALADTLMGIERLVPSLPVSERRLCVEWSVDAADAVGRHDLSARIHAANHRAGTSDAAVRWRAWAFLTLGGTTGIPESGGE